MKIWKSKRVRKCILFLGLVPFLVCVGYGIYSAFVGVGFLWAPKEFGLKGFLTAVVFWSVVYWPTYLAGLAILCPAAWMIHKDT